MLKRFYQNHQKQIDRFDGLLVNNTVLERGLVIAPVVVMANTVTNSLILGLSFILITFFGVLLASFVPKVLPYAIRVILYVLLAALLYIPVAWLMQFLFSEAVFQVGIFLPLLITNSLIVTKTETRFLKKKRLEMILDVFCHTLGFFLVILVVGALREVLGSGTFLGESVGDGLYALTLPFGGFILLGFLAAALQRFRLYLHSADQTESEQQKGGGES